MAQQYGEFLKNLLRPLGIYDLTDGSVNGSALDALGSGLDGVSGALDDAEREALLATAEDEGLERREALFARRPAAPTTALRRAAILALEQIGGDSLTPAAIGRTIAGCGIRAVAQETGTAGTVQVRFPDVAGEPEDYARIRSILLDILPCHLAVEFYLHYLTWAECESQGMTWASVEAAGYTFETWMTAVPLGS